MDIGVDTGFPAEELSNLYGHEFWFRGVVCGSMEGLLQSFKFDDPNEQIDVCSLVGMEAKKRGKTRNDAWRSAQTLWWLGKAIRRDSMEYQRLLDNAYEALSWNKDFQHALISTGAVVLEHSIGKSDLRKTVLTRMEFCQRLLSLRKRLQKLSAAGLLNKFAEKT